MGRKPSTQWDFGELFPTAETRTVFSVTDLTLRLKRLIEKKFTNVLVSGEISNWRLQSSDHAYFVLKDANAQLNCVLFRGGAGGRPGRAKDHLAPLDEWDTTAERRGTATGVATAYRSTLARHSEAALRLVCLGPLRRRSRDESAQGNFGCEGCCSPGELGSLGHRFTNGLRACFLRRPE